MRESPPKSIVVTFQSPAGRCLSRQGLCDRYGGIVDRTVNGVKCYCEESPLIVQPDLLIDTTTNGFVGLSFELTAPDWMLPRCKQFLTGLDPRTIRLSGLETLDNGATEPDLYLDVLWSDSDSYERKFGQLGYGLWAFMYRTPDPSLLHDEREWTQPEALLFADVEQIPYPVHVGETSYEEISVEVVGEER